VPHIFSGSLKRQKPTLGFLVLLIASCGGGGSDSPPSSRAPESTTPPQSSIEPTFDCDNQQTDNSLAFTDITRNAGLCFASALSPEDSTPARVAGGVAVTDYNGDGLPDVYITPARNSPGRLFRLEPNGVFTEVTAQAGIRSISTDLGALFLDIDQNGWPDLISVQEGPSMLQVYRNRGDGTFIDTTESTGLTLTKPGFSLAAGDYDLDGDLDLFIAHWIPNEKQNRWEFLWQNQGDGTFKDVSDLAEVGRFDLGFNEQQPQLEFEYSFTPIFADINDDRYPDLLLASDFNSSQILINSAGSALISNRFGLTDRAGMGAAVADYDNDGDLDWFVSAIGDPREEFLRVSPIDGNRLYQNDGLGTFTNVTDIAGVRQAFWGWGSCFADVNNDGFLDLFIVNGHDGLTEQEALNGSSAEFNNDPVKMYINNGDGSFTDRAQELGLLHTDIAHGLACYDYDQDGDIDLLIVNNGKAPTLYRNNHRNKGSGANNNFLSVRLQGLKENPKAVGARVYLTSAGQEQMRELQLGNNYVSQNPVVAHFGLGGTQTVDRLKIVWPGLDARETTLQNLEANQFLTLEHPDL